MKRALTAALYMSGVELLIARLCQRRAARRGWLRKAPMRQRQGIHIESGIVKNEMKEIKYEEAGGEKVVAAAKLTVAVSKICLLHNRNGR